MPIIKSAKKKVRQDKKRRLVNLKTINNLKKTLSAARKNATVATVKEAVSLVDQAAKKKIIHKNKADRLKSRLAKRLGLEKVEKTVKKPTIRKKRVSRSAK